MKSPWYALLSVLFACGGPQEIKSDVKSHDLVETNLAFIEDVAVLGPSVEVSGPSGAYLDAIRAALPRLPGRIKLEVGPNLPSGSSGHLETQVAIDALWLALPLQTRQRSRLEIRIDYKRSNPAKVGKTVGEIVMRRIGDARPKNAAIPVLAPPAKAVALGQYIACSLHTDSSVHCWGRPAEPFVGAVPSKTPIDNAVEIAAGHSVACARLDSGDIQCIGRDREQQGLSPYGLGRVCDVTKAQKIAMHDKVGCAIVDKGNVRCWIAELQTPQGESCAYPSTEISGIRGATALSIGAGGLCALAGGKVLCWGVPLGWEKLAKPANLPSGIDVMVGIYPCVLGASGQIKCSTKSAAGYKLETKLPAGSKVMLSGFYGCAITPDAKQVCWGSNQGGAMEDGEAIPGPQPVLDNVTALSLAHDASCAVTRDGAIWCRGDALRSGQPRRPEMARRLSRLTIY